MDADGQHATEMFKNYQNANETKIVIWLWESERLTQKHQFGPVGNSITVFLFKYLHSFNIKIPKQD